VPSREGAGVTGELETTLDWIVVKAVAIDGLTERLASELSSETPRIDEVNALRRRLDLVKNWDVLAVLRAMKGLDR